jgi:hypothetical protein
MHATAVGDEPRADGGALLEVAAASTKEIARTGRQRRLLRV